MSAARIATLCGGSIATSAPLKRVKTLAAASPRAYSAYTPAPNVIIGAQQAAPGSMSGAAVARGSSISDAEDMVIYAAGASTGTVRNDLGTNPAVGAWIFASQTLTSGSTLTVGSAALRQVSNIRSQVILSFEAECDIFGVILGPNQQQVRVFVDKLDGAGYRDAAPLRPYPKATIGGTVYFDFSTDDQSTRTRRYVVRADAPFCGLAFRAAQVPRPFDLRKVTPTVARFGDSIGYVLQGAALQIGALADVSHGDGGTGYAKGNAVNFSGGTPVSNADIDPATLLTSMSGNAGFNDGMLPEFQYTDRTDALIAAQPDIVIGAHGINDSTDNDFNSWGWRVSRSVAKVWHRLRDGLGSSVLVCCAPWTGAQRGVDGVSGGERFVAITIKNEFAQIAGPTIFIDNRDSTWIVKRADGTIITGSTGSGPWITGIGTVQAPTGTGNADQYVGDGTHPAAWSYTTLTADATLPAGTLTVAATTGATGNFPPSGKVSIQPATGAVTYPGQVITYTGKTQTSLTGCTGGTGTFPSGSRVFMYETVPGEDYYGNKVAAALCAALAVL